MPDDRGHTHRPFTLAICTECTPEVVDAVLPELRRTVRNCPHAMLVRTDCLLGRFTCAAQGSGAGVVLVLQPCTLDRAPIATAQWVGPLRTRSDAEAACAWIAAGVWDPLSLPTTLRVDVALARAAGLN